MYERWIGKERPVTAFCYNNNIDSSFVIINGIFHGGTVKNANILEKLLFTK
jgi:hypothetical protein